MDLEPEKLRLQQLRPAVPARVERPAPEPIVRPLQQAVPALKPAPVRPATDPILRLMLFVLLIGGTFLTLSRDVKRVGPPLANPAAESIPDEIVVDLADSASTEQIAQLENRFGIHLQYASDAARKWKLMYAKVDPMRRLAILEGLRAQKDLVEAADVNYVEKLMGAAGSGPNDPSYGIQWHMRMIDVEGAWRYTRGGGAIVGIIDSGFGYMDARGAYHQPQDAAKMKVQKPKDVLGNDDVPEDEVGHGTHVTGTIAESADNSLMGTGVAPDSTVIPVKALGPRGGSTLSVATAIRYAADQGATVINMSLSGPHTDVKEQACQYAHQKGAALICAAGNDGKEGTDYPAHYKECIAVSAVGPTRRIARYSNYGDEIDIAGPGGDSSQGASGQVFQDTVEFRRIRTGYFSPPQVQVVEGFFGMEGTSMATPHVAGVAALLSALGVRDPEEIRSLLRKSASSLGAPKLYGAGLLNAKEAVKLSGRSPYQRYFGFAALALGAMIAFVFTRREAFTRVLVFLILGYATPWAVEKLFGFGSAANFLGHSVVLPIIWLLTPDMKPDTLRQAAGFTFGMAIHFALDLQSGASPFQVHPQSRVLLWYLLNLIMAVHLTLSAMLRQKSPRRKTSSAYA